MSPDQITREKLREALLRASTMVGMGLMCGHCGEDTPEHTKFCQECGHPKASGGSWMDDIKNAFDPNKNGVNDLGRKIKNEFTNPNSVLAQTAKKVGHEFTDKDSLLRAKYLPEAANIANKVTPFLAAIPGVGEAAEALNSGIQAAQKVNQGAKSVGLGLVDKSKHRWSAEAKARARERAANPNSHANKVKRYLKAHPGTSFGAASKAVANK